MNTLKQKRKLAILEDRLQNEEETYETLIEHIKNSSVTNDESIGEIKERLAELHEQIATKEYEIQALLLQPQSAERDRQLKDYRADFRLNTVEFDKLKKIITKKLKIPVNDPAKNVEDVYQEIQNSKKIHLMNSTDIDFEYLGKLKRMIDTMKEFRTIASQTTSGEDKIRHMKIFEDKICEYKREMMLVKMQLRGDRLTLIGGDQRIENISSYLNTAERNLDETIDAIRETRRKIMNDEYLQDSEEIFALRKFLPITIFEKLHDELGEFLERPQRSKTYDLGATTLAAYAVDLANKPETDLREREQLQRSINRANRGLTRQETEISNIRKKIASIVKEREDLQFKIRTHKRLTARNMVDLSEELKTMREKIMDVKSKAPFIEKTIETLEGRIQEYKILNDQKKIDDTVVKSFQDQLASKRRDLKTVQSQIDDEEEKLRKLLSKIYDYDFQNEQQATLCQPVILEKMLSQYENGKILEARMRAQLGEANERLRERQNYIGNTKKQLRILAGEQDLDPFSDK